MTLVLDHDGTGQKIECLDIVGGQPGLHAFQKRQEFAQADEPIFVERTRTGTLGRERVGEPSERWSIVRLPQHQHLADALVGRRRVLDRARNELFERTTAQR